MKTRFSKTSQIKTLMSLLSIVLVVSLAVTFVLAETADEFSMVSNRGIVPIRIAGNDSGGPGSFVPTASKEVKFFDDDDDADPGIYYFPGGSNETNYKIRVELATHMATGQVYMKSWRTSPDTLVLHVASKGGNFYNLYDYEDIQFDDEMDKIFDDGNIWSPLNESGNTQEDTKVYGISHITFYYNEIIPPETDPTTSETDPTTSETDPTTSETDPTTSETDPTTSETDTTNITVTTESIPLASVTTTGMDLITVTTPQIPLASTIENQQIPKTGESGNNAALIYTGLVLLITAGGAFGAKKLLFRKSQKTNN